MSQRLMDLHGMRAKYEALNNKLMLALIDMKISQELSK